MKKLSPLSLLLTVFASTALAADTDEMANQKVQQAILTTQLLAARICGDKANLDPQILGRHSTAVMFVLSLQTVVGTPDDLAKKPDLLAEKMGQMMCGQGGILQFEPRAS